MFQKDCKVLIAHVIGRIIARKTDIAQIAKLYSARLLECNEGSIYSFRSEVDAKGFYDWLHALICDTPDGFVPRNGFQS